MEFEIKEMVSRDSNLYRRFFRVGLLEDDENFRISLADDEMAPFPTLDKEDSFTLGAMYANELCGVVSFSRDGSDREKLRHKGTLFRMYVGKIYRGKGISNSLMEEVIKRAKGLENMEQINLTVLSGNLLAKGLYEKFGFVVYGKEKNALKWKGIYKDEEQMVLFLK